MNRKHTVFYGVYLTSNWKKYRWLLQQIYNYEYDKSSKSMVMTLKDGATEEDVKKIDNKIDKMEGYIDITREENENFMLEEYYNDKYGKY